MRILVTGGSGFIGAPLCRSLAAAGHALTVVSRSAPASGSVSAAPMIPWDATALREAMGRVDAVVNLAGEPIAARRWTPDQKARIRQSRVESTRRLVDAIAASSRRPSVLVSASAIGFYGNRGHAPLDETSEPGSGFLAETCQAWEAEASRAEALGVRVARLRIGLVLAPDGGALAKMLPPFRAGIGGPVGTGRQWVSWIHRDDVLELIAWALTDARCAGVVNATAPTPLPMGEFCSELGRALHRPSWLPVPGVALRLLLGDMAELLLTGQRVLPRAALSAGFRFRYPALHEALAACFKGV